MFNKEDHVIFNVAKKLKEIGYDELTRYTYIEDDNTIGISDKRNSELPENVYSCPHLYDVIKWFRNKKIILNNAPDEPFGEPLKWFYFHTNLNECLDNYGTIISASIYDSYYDSINECILNAIDFYF